MTYSAFLSLLLSLGSKVPQFLQLLADLQELLTKYAGLFTFPVAEKSFGAEAPPELSAEDAANEAAVVALCQAHHSRDLHPHVFGAIGDGKILALLNAAWSFVSAHPELLTFILKLIGVGV